MKLIKVILVILLAMLIAIPGNSLAKPKPSPEPQPTEESQPLKLEANPEKVNIYVFAIDTHKKMSMQVFPVYINGLLINSLTYNEYVRYEISETSIRVATQHLWVTTIQNLFSEEGSTYFAYPVYSSAKIEGAQLGEVYCFEIAEKGKQRVNLIPNEEAEKRLKKFKEQAL